MNVSFTLHGIGVSKGIAIGKVYILDHDLIEVNQWYLSQQALEEEISRFRQAVSIARQQLQRIHASIPQNATEDVAAFIETHLLMLDDQMLVEAPIRIIREQQCNAEWALKLQCDHLTQIFESMDDPYLRSRRRDVEHVVARIQKALRGYKDLSLNLEENLANAIVVADDLTPADTVFMQHHGILAFATEYGGTTSHTAILARSLGIPALVGLHRARHYIQQEDILIIDGFQGVMLVAPDEYILHYYRRRQEEEKRHKVALRRLKQSPTMTADGVPITLHANIEFPDDMNAVKRVGSRGIGLFRTEFLFMNRQQPPSEDEHFEAYVHVVKALDGGPLTIRTVDLGADKQTHEMHYQNHLINNPALGLRAIRLCLKNQKLFRLQLRAILRASAYGNVRLLLPMLCSPQELMQVRNILEDVRQELTQKSQRFDPNMALGAMVEIPAMAICTDLFLPHLDFLSIGTNDLIQYTLAIDRCDDSVNYLYDPLHPAVLRLIKTSIHAANRAHKSISLCGEMASDIRYVRLLLGLGLRAFSVNPESYLEIKQIINQSRMQGLAELTNKMLTAHSQAEMNHLLEKINA